MYFMDRRCDDQTPARKIGPEAAPGDLKRRLIDLSCPGFDGKHGFEFDDRQTRAAIGERSVRRFDRCNRSRPPGETTSQRACVEKMILPLAFFAKLDDAFGSRTGD